MGWDGKDMAYTRKLKPSMEPGEEEVEEDSLPSLDGLHATLRSSDLVMDPHSWLAGTGGHIHGHADRLDRG